MSIKIMVDSATDFTEQQAKELGLLFVPISVTFDGEEFFDGVDLFADTFYQKLESCKTLPQTSLINEHRWSEAMENAVRDGSQLIVITLSSKISGTYQAAIDAARKFDGNVFVVDSMNVACGEGILAKYALMLRDEGKTAEEICERLNEKKKDICIYAVIDTLKHLKKGGRISATTAFIGTTLSIKPIVSMVDGEVKIIGKALGNKRGNLTLNKLIERAGGVDFNLPWGYLWSGNDRTNIDKYIQDSAQLIQGREYTLHVIGSTIGTHVGAGAVGFAFFKK